MTLQKPDITFESFRYREALGVFVVLTERKLEKKRIWLLPNKYWNKRRFFWRPTHQCLDKKFFQYIEYGNNRMPFGNVWYEIIIDINSPAFIYGHPDIDRLCDYELRRVKYKNDLHKTLMTVFSKKVLPF